MHDGNSGKAIQGKSDIMQPVRALLFNLLCVVSVFGGGYAHAQDAIPETPPELRDFRLDPERSQPQPEPQPVTPPPVVSTVPEERAEPVAPVRTQQTRRQPAATEPVGIAEQAPVEQSEPETTAPTFEQTEPVALPEAAPIATDTQPEPVSNYGLIGGIAGTVLLGLIGLWLAYRRRRRRAELAYDEPAIAPPLPAPVRAPARPLVAKPIIANQPEPRKSTDMALAFVPEKATVSFTTLTVKGQLQIANDSAAMAQNMQFRAGLISASNDQHLAMEAFFADTTISANDLGEAKPGEKLAMSIELTVPLTEMQSFPLGDQRLLVPIMVAELAYKAEDGFDRQVRIASMLGREARPPQPKMGPLRLDQGPRSFAPLGQRPLYT